jgi:hypothetical protein
MKGNQKREKNDFQLPTAAVEVGSSDVLRCFDVILIAGKLEINTNTEFIQMRNFPHQQGVLRLIAFKAMVIFTRAIRAQLAQKSVADCRPK